MVLRYHRGAMTRPVTVILRLPTVLQRTGLSRSTVYSYIAQGTFPKPVRLGPRSIGFVDRDIESWIQDRIAESYGGTATGAASSPRPKVSLVRPNQIRVRSKTSKV